MKETLALLMEADTSKKKSCTHYAFVNNTCAGCKKSVNKCDDPVTHSFGYIDRSLSLTVEGIHRLRDLNLKNLLDRKKLYLVLDLDNTLIHGVKAEKGSNKTKNKKSSKNDVYEILGGQVLVKVRPGVRDFLEKASQLFDLSIYTSADQKYAREIAKILESDETVRFLRVASKEDCINKTGQKGLDVVLCHQRVVLIVDDKDDVWDVKNRGNVVKIQPYEYFQKEGLDEDGQELARVLGILKEVHAKFYDKKQGNNNNHDANKDVKQLLEKVMMVDSSTSDSFEYY